MTGSTMGEHHHENLFTKWAIGYWMYEKHGIDKRKITYSAQVLNGKMSRDEALGIVKKAPFDDQTKEADTTYVLKKLNVDQSEFDKIWRASNKSFEDYPSYYPMVRRLTKLLMPVLIKVLKVKPKIFYEMEGRKSNS